MQFDILQNKRIIGALYCFCLLKRGVKLTPWSSAGTRIWNLGTDFFPPLLSQKTSDAPVNPCSTTHFPLDIYYSSSLIFLSSQNLFSQIHVRGSSFLLRQIQFNISLWRPWPGYETSPVLNIPWIKTFWRISATCQCEEWDESWLLRTPTLPCKSQAAHGLSHVFCSCANSAKKKPQKTLRSRGFWCPVVLQPSHINQVHAVVRADCSPTEEPQTLLCVPSFKHFNSPVKCCRIS